MSYNTPKIGDVISKWEMAEPYKCTESGPSESGKTSAPLDLSDYPDRMEKPGNANTSETMSESGTPNGDNPPYSFDVSLPSEGDTRHFGGSPKSDPSPGKPGA
jgi:hypothetical protein